MVSLSLCSCRLTLVFLLCLLCTSSFSYATTQGTEPRTETAEDSKPSLELGKEQATQPNFRGNVDSVKSKTQKAEDTGKPAPGGQQEGTVGSSAGAGNGDAITERQAVKDGSGDKGIEVAKKAAEADKQSKELLVEDAASKDQNSVAGEQANGLQKSQAGENSREPEMPSGSDQKAGSELRAGGGKQEPVISRDSSGDQQGGFAPVTSQGHAAPEKTATEVQIDMLVSTHFLLFQQLITDQHSHRDARNFF
jgi:hypothetical protein